MYSKNECVRAGIRAGIRAGFELGFESYQIPYQKDILLTWFE